MSPATRNNILRAATAAAAARLDTIMAAAINACDKTKSHSIICAVAIATREFIYYNTKNTGTNTNADAILTHLFTNINFGGGVTVLKPQIQAYLNAYATAPFAASQLNPLIGAACAAGDAVYAAAKLAIMNYVKDNAVAATTQPDSKDPALAAIKNAMESVIDNFDNFAAFAPRSQLELIRSFCSAPPPVWRLAARMLPRPLPCCRPHSISF